MKVCLAIGISLVSACYGPARGHGGPARDTQERHGDEFPGAQGELAQEVLREERPTALGISRLSGSAV